MAVARNYSQGGVYYEGGDEEGVYPRFFMEAVEDPDASALTGRPEFKDVEYVEILRAGENKTKPVFRVTDVYRDRWRKQYERFRDNQDARIPGMPLEEWVYLRPARLRQLKSMDIHVVEQIAEWPDGRLDQFGEGGADLRNRARDALGQQDDALADMRKQIKTLEEDLANKTAQIQALQQPAQVPGEASTSKGKNK